MWLGTDLVFDAFKFFIDETPHGVFQAHAYPYDDRMSTFIVETHERRVAAGRARHELAPGPLPPGVSDTASVEFCASLFADALEGHQVFANNSKWINFVTVRNRRWCADNVVLLGDAAHTAHFSIGSGTKLAMEDAVALAWAFRTSGDDCRRALRPRTRPSGGRSSRARSAPRRPRSSGSRGIGRYVDQERTQFAFNLLTRSRRVTYDNLRLRDPEFVERGRRALRRRGRLLAAAADVHAAAAARAGASQPGVVSPMDMYSAVDGTPSDFHLVHLGSRALGGAALVMSEMICVSDVGPDHARVRGDVPRGARRGVAADRRLRPRLRRLRDRGADRPLRAQGLDEADVGGDR